VIADAAGDLIATLSRRLGHGRDAAE